MFKRTQIQAFVLMAVGALLGFAAASGKKNSFQPPRAAAEPGGQTAPRSGNPGNEPTPQAECCSEAANKGQLLVLAARNRNADITSNTYYDWFLSNAGVIYGLLAGTEQFLNTFKDYPPRQRAASFSIDQAVEKLRRGLGGK